MRIFSDIFLSHIIFLNPKYILSSVNGVRCPQCFSLQAVEALLPLRVVLDPTADLFFFFDAVPVLQRQGLLLQLAAFHKEIWLYLLYYMYLLLAV